MSNLNPYFIGSNRYIGCNYVRLLLPFHELGWDGTHLSMSKDSRKSPKQVSEEIPYYNPIAFHRPNKVKHHKLALSFKNAGKKIVFDNDDTFHFNKEHPMFSLYDDKEKLLTYIKETNDLLHNFITNADLVTTTTETLANEYKLYNDNVHILPNCINPDDWDKPLRNEGDKIRLGVIGSTAYAHDYTHIKEQIKELDKTGKFTIVVFGLQSKKDREINKLVTNLFQKEYGFWLELDNVEHIPWCAIEDYPRILNEARLDMAIIPRSENYFNKCKSNVKFLELAMCEVPVIAQSFEHGPYEEITDDMGILIKDNDNWFNSVTKLAENRSERLRLGSNAHQYALDNYNIKDNAYKWEEVYKSILT